MDLPTTISLSSEVISMKNTCLEQLLEKLPFVFFSTVDVMMTQLYREQAKSLV
jgi:hypothetical protein